MVDLTVIPSGIKNKLYTSYYRMFYTSNTHLYDNIRKIYVFESRVLKNPCRSKKSTVMNCVSPIHCMSTVSIIHPLGTSK